MKIEISIYGRDISELIESLEEAKNMIEDDLEDSIKDDDFEGKSNAMSGLNLDDYDSDIATVEKCVQTYGFEYFFKK